VPTAPRVWCTSSLVGVARDDALLWQPAQENAVLSPKPIHFGH
jgi:hypothetical protein